jgi:hypothetical protein
MRPYAGIFAAVACLAGCNDRPSAPPSSTPPSTVAPAATAVTTTPDLAAPPANAELTAVTWPKAPPDPKVVSLLPKAVRAQVEVSAIPVLVPNDAALLAAGTLIVEPAYYAWSARSSGATLNVHATRIAFKYDSVPPVPGQKPMRGTKGFVTVNEGIYSASWIENGVSYSLDVECESAKDARCRDDKYVLELTNGLSYVGGRAQ